MPMRCNGPMRFISVAMRNRILAGNTPTWMVRHSRYLYIKIRYLSAPPWIKPSDFAELIAEAVARSQETGVRHVLDHIIPVTHPFVCGLTVPWNIQVIPYAVNHSKGNKWHPDQLPLDV